MKRQYSVDGPNGYQTYQGFDKFEGDADYAIVPYGVIPEVEGWFYCTHDTLLLAIAEVVRYNLEQFGRHDPQVTIVPLRESPPEVMEALRRG